MNETDQRTVLEATRELCRLVDATEVPVQAEYGLAQFPMAALQRCVELLRVSVLCIEHGHPDTVGVLVRAAVETWMTGSYILFGGTDAFAQLEKESLRQLRAMNDANGAGAGEFLAGLADDLDDAVVHATDVKLDANGQPMLLDRFSVAEMARALAPLMESLVDDHEDTVEMYDTMYRSFSTFDAHGLEPLKRRVDQDDVNRLSVKVPVPWVEPHGAILVATTMTSKLARWMLRVFGRSEDDVIAIQERLLAIGATEHAAMLDGARPEVRAAVPRKYGGEYRTAP